MASYFDYASATPVSKEVFEAMKPYFSELFYNPSAMYRCAKNVEKDLKNARQRVASVLGARANEIIFTAGGTEANNLAIKGVLNKHKDGKVIVSAIEHDSILRPASNYNHILMPVKKNGLIDFDKLERALLSDDDVVLVSVMLANNEIGTIEPIRQIAKLIEKVREKRRSEQNKRPIYLHSDACQAGLWLDLHVSRLGVDLMTLNGGKIYGPKQSGVLYVKSGVELTPLIEGGGQERSMRSGTENVAFAIGFATALEIAQAEREVLGQKTKALRDKFFKDFSDDMDKASVEYFINGSIKQRLPNSIHLTLPGTDNEYVLFKLDEEGIMGAAGSACSASNDLPSHVLSAIGLHESEIRASYRFSLGRETTDEDISRLREALCKIVEK